MQSAVMGGRIIFSAPPSGHSAFSELKLMASTGYHPSSITGDSRSGDSCKHPRRRPSCILCAPGQPGIQVTSRHPASPEMPTKGVPAISTRSIPAIYPRGRAPMSICSTGMQNDH